MEIEQADRWLKLTTPLGENALVPIRLEGRETLSKPYEFFIECVSPRSRIEPDAVLGKSHTVEIGHGTALRRINGLVRALGPGAAWDRDLRLYRLEIVPTLWLLTQTRNIRIYQEKSVIDIVKSVFSDNGLDDYDLAGIQENHPKRDYIVQYRESDFDFVSRLMEEEGIFYFFEHKTDSHTLKLADTASAYVACELDEIDYHPAGEVAGAIQSWTPRVRFRSGKWTLRDYDFEKPSTNLTGDKNTILGPGAFTHEVYDYPGRYTTKARGGELARLRMEAHEAGYSLVDGESTVGTLMPGGVFTIHMHPSADQNDKRFVLREVVHNATDFSHISGYSGPGSSYSNSFTCQPAETVFRPEPTTPKPVVAGPHTAMVVGPSGEEIHCDKHGRIKVQFHWDRQGKNDEKSSCWLRVAQMMAGRNWGTLFTPRIGMEVVVEFLEGDPDKPMVVGCVYNGVNKPPYDLPGNKTQSGFKSRSSPGGGAADFNELRFEDKAGSEEIYFHAQRDFKRVVERDDTLDVERDETITVKRGDRTINVDLGSEYTEAQTSIEMKVGQNSIVIDQSGITIKGLQVKIEGTASVSAKAPMTEVKGSGVLTLKGGLIQIN